MGVALARRPAGHFTSVERSTISCRSSFGICGAMLLLREGWRVEANEYGTTHNIGLLPAFALCSSDSLIINLGIWHGRSC